MVSIDLKDACLQVPCLSREQEIPLLHGIQEGFPIQGPVFLPCHGSPGVYQGHGSCISHFTQSQCPDTSLFG